MIIKSLKSRLLSTTLLTIVIMIGLLSIYLSVVSRHYLLNIALRGMASQARLVSGNISGVFLDRPSVDIDSLADSYSRTIGYRITVIDSSGRVLGDSDEDGAGLLAMDNHLGRPEIRKALEAGSGHSLRYSQTLKKELIYFAVPIIIKNKFWGYCRIAWPFNDFAAYRWHLFISLISGLLLSAVILLAIYNVYWNTIIKAIKKVEGAAARISAGDLTARAPTNQGSSEINTIAASLNQMAQSWEKSLSDLKNRSLHLAAVLEGMTEGVIVIDKMMKIKLINTSACRMFGTTPAEFLGKLLIEVIRHPNIGDWVKDRRSNLEFELAGRKYLAHGTLLERDDIGSGIVIVVTDVTDYKRLEGIRQDFVANVSHELKTPLSAIIGYTQAIHDEQYHGQEQLRDFLERIRRQSERMDRIVSDLLTLSALETGSYQFNPRQNRLAEMVERAVDNVQQQVSQKQQDLKIRQPLPEIMVSADDDKLIQALTNLLDNASKYTPTKGTIELSAELKENKIRLTVSDTGPGITSDHLPRLFERFYRVDKGRSREVGGTGLGLAIVKHIIEMHRGTVGVSSQLGKGSAFWIEFPT